jgi:hypothetical protein
MSHRSLGRVHAAAQSVGHAPELGLVADGGGSRFRDSE